tara:strand:- start:8706 stop:12737 length:4032 start_codon:yes stop_codon:yes gene_type:complete
VATTVKHSAWKRWRRRLSFAFSGLLLLLVALVLVLHTGWGKEQVRGRLEAALGKQVRGSVSIASLDYDFPFGDIRVKGVEIRDLSDAPAISVEQLDLSIGIWATVTEKLLVESLHVQGVVVTTHIDEDGRNSLRGLFIKREGAKGKGFSVHSARIERFTLQLTRDDGDTLSLRNGSLQARIEKGEDTEVFLDAFGATFSATQGELVLIEGEVRQDGAVLKTNPERTTLQLQPLQTTVQIKRAGKPTVKTTVQVASGELTVTPTSLVTNVKQLVLGPLAIEEAAAVLGFERGNPVGHQEIQLTGLVLDSQTVERILGRELPVGDVIGEASIVGPLEELAVLGMLQTKQGQFEVAGTIDIIGPNAPSYSLATTTDITVGALPSLTNSPLRVGPLLPTELRLRLSGEGLPSEGGSLALQLEGMRTIDGKQSETLRVRAHKVGDIFHLDSLTLKLLGSELVGEGSMNTAEDGGEVTAKLTLSGNAKQALAKLEALGLRVSPPLHLPSELFLDLEVRGSPDERILVTILPSKTAIAGGRVQLEGEAVFEPREEALELISADGVMNVQGLSIAGLARLARKPAKVQGRISGSVRLRQRGDARTISHNLTVRLPEMDLQVASRGEMRPGQWRGRVGVRELGTKAELAWLEGRLPLSTTQGVRLRKRGQLRLDAELAPVLLSDHLGRLPPALRESLTAKVADAEVGLSVHLEGTANRPKGTIKLLTTVSPAKQPETSIGIEFAAELESPKDDLFVVRPSATVSHSALQDPLLAIAGSVAIVPNRRRPQDSEITLDLTTTVLKRSLASLAPLVGVRGEKLKQLVGDVEVQMQVTGSAKAQALRADVSVGADNPVRIAVNAEKVGTKVTLDVQSAVNSLLLAEVWPSFLPKRIDEPLVLSSDLGLAAELSLDGVPRLVDVQLRGATKISGAEVAVPQSNRTWRDLSIEIAGQGKTLSLGAKAFESDEQAKNRSVKLTARANLETGTKVGFRAARARLQTEKWLLFGGTLGLPDAPRATLDSDLEIEADLSGDVAIVDVTAKSLRYWDPDREVFTHGFVNISPKGDLVFLGDENRPLGVVGPVVPEASLVTAPLGPPKARIRLHLPEPIVIAKGPLVLRVRGEVEQVLPSAGPTGQVEVLDGAITFFGQAFPFTESRIALEGGPPKVDIFFADEVAPDILRQLSRESAGTDVQIHLRPVGGGPLIGFGGAGNTSMIESLSLLHTGHGYVLSQPEAPASVTVRAPQGMHPLMIAFVKANIPKLNLLDRFAVWSRPYDANTTYGQLRYLDATRYLADGAARLRLMLRPQQIGRSSSEAHLDRLFVDSESVQLGVGLRAGSRLGGGVGLFFEWTSED